MHALIISHANEANPIVFALFQASLDQILPVAVQETAAMHCHGSLTSDSDQELF